jgi:hypothetical protein
MLMIYLMAKGLKLLTLSVVICLVAVPLLCVLFVWGSVYLTLWGLRAALSLGARHLDA